MPGEFQKPIEFDNIQIGDEILVEFFTKEIEFKGTERGVARERINDCWFFEGMPPLLSRDFFETENRMFKVTVFSAPVDPLDKLEAEIRRQGDLVQEAWSELGVAADDKYFSGKLAGLRLALDLIRQQKEG